MLNLLGVLTLPKNKLMTTVLYRSTLKKKTLLITSVVCFFLLLHLPSIISLCEPLQIIQLKAKTKNEMAGKTKIPRQKLFCELEPFEKYKLFVQMVVVD